MPGRATYFNGHWLTNPLYKGWIKKKDNKTALCSFCDNKVIDISSLGETALKQHAGLPPHEHLSKAHKTKCPVDDVNSILQFAEKHNEEPEKTETQVNAVQKKQLSICDMIEKEYIVDAEIRWCLKVVKSKYSQRSCNDIV